MAVSRIRSKRLGLSVPDSNFVKISTEEITPLGDAIYICWNKNNLFWEGVIDKSNIIENKLDTGKYRFKENFPED